MMLMMLANGASNQHHRGSVSPFLASHAPNDPSLVKIVSHPKLPWGLEATFKKSLRAVGIRCWSACEFGAVLEWGPGGAPGETEVR